jgi:hypothetical protein
VRSAPFERLRAAPIAASASRDGRWRRGFWLSLLVPTLLFYPCFIAVYLLVPATVILPQTVTTQVAVWALVSAGAGLALRRFGPGAATSVASSWGSAIGIALATTAIAYLALFAVDRLFSTDLRFWIVAVKWPDTRQWGIALLYLLPITLAFLGLQRGVIGLTVTDDSTARSYRNAVFAMSGGIIGMLLLIYAAFFATGTLVTGFDPLTTVIALQFVAVLPVIAIVAIFAWRRTGGHRAGSLLTAMLVTLYVVAGTATQG